MDATTTADPGTTAAYTTTSPNVIMSTSTIGIISISIATIAIAISMATIYTATSYTSAITFAPAIADCSCSASCFYYDAYCYYQNCYDSHVYHDYYYHH
eukprot:3941859-Pyramimonas_sp.AAC.1